MIDKMPVWDLDADLQSADWMKTRWDLPPYKSKEFFQVIAPEDLEAFRKLPIYNHAVAKGLIFDDEWLANHTSDYIKD